MSKKKEKKRNRKIPTKVFLSIIKALKLQL